MAGRLRNTNTQPLKGSRCRTSRQTRSKPSIPRRKSAGSTATSTRMCGVTWITTNTLLTRYNDAEALVQGALPPLTANDFAKKPGGAGGEKAMKVLEHVRMGGVNLEKILTPAERGSKDTMVASLQHRLLQSTLKGDQEQALREFLDSKENLNEADIRTAIRLMMSTPEYQVT